MYLQLSIRFLIAAKPLLSTEVVDANLDYNASNHLLKPNLEPTHALLPRLSPSLPLPPPPPKCTFCSIWHFCNVNGNVTRLTLM